MRKIIKKHIEFDHFQKLSDEWWDPYGKFKALHALTPIRIEYIKNNISVNHNNISKYNKILKEIEILDLGCGGGLVCEPLARLGAKVTGIDFIKKNIENAKIHARFSKLDINYKHQDLLSLKLNKKYDVILMLEVIEHIENWKNVVINVLKYLKPKGKIIFSSINRTLHAKIFAIFFAEKVLKWIPKNTHNYEKLVKPKELMSLLENNKMKIVDTSGLVFNPISNDWFLNKKLIKINYFCTATKIN